MRRSTKFMSWSMSSAQNMYKRQLQKSEDQMCDSGRVSFPRFRIKIVCKHRNCVVV